MKRKSLLIVAASTVLSASVLAGALAPKTQFESKAIAPSGGYYTLYMGIGAATGWNEGNERYALNYWGDASGWVDFTATNGSLYKALVPSGATSAIVVRMNGATSENNWDNKWNQTYDIDLSDKLGKSDNTIFVNAEDSQWKKNNYSWDERQPELAPGSAYLRGNWDYGWCDVSKEMDVDGTTLSIENVLLSKDAQVKAVKINNDYSVQWFDATSVGGNSDATFVNPNVVINTTGNYNISVNTSTKAYTIDVYEDTDLTIAAAFADDFKTSMQKYCPVYGNDEAKGTAKLASEWSDFSDRYNDNVQTTAQARAYLKTLDESKMDDFRRRYDQILTDYYSLLSGYDFLNRASDLGLGSKPSFVTANKESNSMLVVTITAVGMIVAAGTVAFLRKKKEN